MSGAGLAQRVVRWQRRHGRHHLPWQRDRDPYRIWLSEVMLQQTQVATVLGYYERFVGRFPDLRALAAAPLDDVLAAWSGLGYYSRARNLHRCAQHLVHAHGGEFPRSAAELARLPGIGRSTAAAIAALAFDERAAILDGNVKRVLARCLGFGADLSVASNLRALWAQAETLLPDREVARYTQGLMDLGATLCTTRNPDCPRCPLAASCAAHRAGRPEAYPVKTRRTPRGRRMHALLWLVRGDRMWLVQRAPRGVWAGLWSLPEAASTAAWLAHLEGWPGQGEALPPIAHALTHFDWQLEPLHWRLPARLPAARLRELSGTLPPGRWVTREQALQLALPAPIRRLIAG
jgi:A/G-specific adenine glycosylase